LKKRLQAGRRIDAEYINLLDFTYISLWSIHSGSSESADWNSIIAASEWSIQLLSDINNHMHWLYLTIAIMSEVVATSALKATEGFTRCVPSFIVIIGYASAFYLLSLTLRTLPLGIAYAVWSGIGVVLVTVVGWVVYHQSLDLPAFIGIGLIVAGVVVLNLFSRAALH
jgi:small multidrug resistance pump